MRAHSTRSMPIPSTLMCEAHCHFRGKLAMFADSTALSSQHYLRLSSAVISHCAQQFLDRVFNSDDDRPRNNRVPDVQLSEMRDFVNQFDVSVIDSVAGVDLQF